MTNESDSGGTTDVGSSHPRPTSFGGETHHFEPPRTPDVATPHSLVDATPDRLLNLLMSGTRNREGDRIGPYVLGREIGRGGAATVYLATDEKHRRSVALKLLHAGASSAVGGD